MTYYEASPALAASRTRVSGTDRETAGMISASDIDEIHNLFLRQAAGETAHDIEVIDTVLARATPGQPDPVTFVARAYRFWGREAVIDHFRAVFDGTWRFEPDPSAIRITPLGRDSAHIYALTRITAGASGRDAVTSEFLVNEVAIRTPDGWRISTIVPVPTQ